MPRNWKNGSARDPQRESSAPGSSSDAQGQGHHDLSFDLFNRAKKGGLKAEKDVNSVPPSSCREWDANFRASKGGKLSIPFHTVVYVDDHGLIRAQHSDEDKSA